MSRALTATEYRLLVEHRLRRHDGTYRWIFDRGAPFMADDGTFAGHDIRNPLGVIKLAAARLQNHAADADAVRVTAGRVERSAVRIENIVGDLLDLSRERNGAGIPLARKPTDLRQVCRQIIEELQAIARERSITLDCDTDVSGSWDESRVTQAIANLASNAVQHGAPGSPVKLRVSAADDPFHSGRDNVGRSGGLGLGLFIAKAIAQAHGLPRSR